MKRQKYTQTFETFWSSLENYFPKGSKVEAFKQFQKLECNQDDAEFISSRYNELVNAKRAVLERGGWTAATKHVCRYIKHEEWDNEICERLDTGRTKDEERRRQYAEFFSGTEEDLGESVGNARSQSLSDGTSNVHYIHLLDEPTD